jgi:hypothetical protein
MPLVVRMTRENCTCAVKLLCHYQPGQLVGQRHGPKREQPTAALGLCSHILRPSIRRPDGEDDVLGALIAACTEPIRPRLGAQLPASPIQKHKNRLCAALLPTEPVKKRGFCPERMAAAFRNSNTTLEIIAHQPLVRVLFSRRSSDMDEGDLHGEENTSKAASRTRRHLHQNLKLSSTFWIIHIEIYDKS